MFGMVVFLQPVWEYAKVYENMTLSTKPEVHNVLSCSQRNTEPQPHVTYNFPVCRDFTSFGKFLRSLNDNYLLKYSKASFTQFQHCTMCILLFVATCKRPNGPLLFIVNETHEKRFHSAWTCGFLR